MFVSPTTHSSIGLILFRRDQLYFDRVQPTIPIVHRARHLSLNLSASLRESEASLCYAMWTLASALSMQYKDIQESLYLSARHSLEQIELSHRGRDPASIESAQGWILIAIYEFMHKYYHRGWMSAGRAMRLVQLMDLHKVDEISPHGRRRMECSSADWIEIEMKRRTFWMAFCLDRFISGRYEKPLTINEQAVGLHLVFWSNYLIGILTSVTDMHSSPCQRGSLPERPSHPSTSSFRSYCHW